MYFTWAISLHCGNTSGLKMHKLKYSKPAEVLIVYNIGKTNLPMQVCNIYISIIILQKHNICTYVNKDTRSSIHYNYTEVSIFVLTIFLLLGSYKK